MNPFDNVAFWLAAFEATSKNYLTASKGGIERHFTFNVDDEEHLLTCVPENRLSIQTGAPVDVLSSSADTIPSTRKCIFAVDKHFVFECWFHYDEAGRGSTRPFGICLKNKFYKTELTKFRDDDEIEHLLMIMRLAMNQ